MPRLRPSARFGGGRGLGPDEAPPSVDHQTPEATPLHLSGLGWGGPASCPWKSHRGSGAQGMGWAGLLGRPGRSLWCLQNTVRDGLSKAHAPSAHTWG